jgi:hypothetical protein
MWPGRAQSRLGCRRGGPSPVSDVARGEPSRVPGTRANPNPAARPGLRLCVLVAPQRLFLPQLVELGEPDGHADGRAELPLPAWIAPVDVVRAGESRCRCSAPGADVAHQHPTATVGPCSVGRSVQATSVLTLSVFIGSLITIVVRRPPPLCAAACVPHCTTLCRGWCHLHHLVPPCAGAMDR